MKPESSKDSKKSSEERKNETNQERNDLEEASAEDQVPSGCSAQSPNTTDDPGNDSTGDTSGKLDGVPVGNVLRVAVPVGVGVATGAAAVAAVPLLLGAFGFTSAGVAAGSIAASLQGPSVAAGSWFALCQSVGAAGLGATGTAGVFSTVGGTGAAATWWTLPWNRKKKAPEQIPEENGTPETPARETRTVASGPDSAGDRSNEENILTDDKSQENEETSQGEVGGNSVRGKLQEHHGASIPDKSDKETPEEKVEENIQNEENPGPNIKPDFENDTCDQNTQGG